MMAKTADHMLEECTRKLQVMHLWVSGLERKQTYQRSLIGVKK